MNWIERTLKKMRGVLEQEEGRAISMSRVEDQIWDLLNGGDPDVWSWPIDVFVDDDQSLFVIVAQGGKLFRVALSVQGEDIALGEWVQVTQHFEPVDQAARFLVRRQADGTHRWLMVAGTAVLNRVGEIDSTALFDSFVSRAERTGNYPRLDFYHMGSADPDLWEFGTADFLARDGVCYIASGTFDMDHPLALATIRAAARDDGRWGASIEFRAHGAPELIVAETEVRIPVYSDGENTRISVVLERDAAGWFTRLGIQEVQRMRKDILEKLRELFGEEDEAALAQFEEQVDGVNRTVTDEGLIHRMAEEDEDDLEEGDTPQDATPARVDDGGVAEVILDDETVRAIGAEVFGTEPFQALDALLRTNQEQIATLHQAYEAQVEENTALRERVAKLAGRIKALERDDAEKQQAWLEDLPAARTVKVTHRPRQAAAEADDPADEADATLADVAERTLSGMPRW